MKPSEKSPDINRFVNQTFGIDRETSITNDVCVMCGQNADQFRDALSRKEFSISGLCQKCQDSVFGGKI
jgi:hypothetical protein